MKKFIVSMIVLAVFTASQTTDAAVWPFRSKKAKPVAQVVDTTVSYSTNSTPWSVQNGPTGFRYSVTETRSAAGGLNGSSVTKEVKNWFVADNQRPWAPEPVTRADWSTAPGAIPHFTPAPLPEIVKEQKVAYRYGWYPYGYYDYYGWEYPWGRSYYSYGNYWLGGELYFSSYSYPRYYSSWSYGGRYSHGGNYRGSDSGGRGRGHRR